MGFHTGVHSGHGLFTWLFKDQIWLCPCRGSALGDSDHEHLSYLRGARLRPVESYVS